MVALVNVDHGDVADSRSPFSTGEVAWALARLHTTFPEEGWDEPARRVLGYIAAERDDVERRFPPVSDHWSAYALAEVGVEWGVPLTDDEQDLVRRQAALFGLQTRYESQRRETGPVRWTRGPIALPAGVGTLGEGLGGDAPPGCRRRGRRGPAGPGRRSSALRRRDPRGSAGVRRGEAAGEQPPEPVAGAWFRLGITQMDDQQHALSALLAAMDDLPDGDDRERDP